ncbi:hypothetical protein GC173_01870 [bacterium]|nr:hypothetical protein [bacterium]
MLVYLVIGLALPLFVRSCAIETTYIAFLFLDKALLILIGIVGLLGLYGVFLHWKGGQRKLAILCLGLALLNMMMADVYGSWRWIIQSRFTGDNGVAEVRRLLAEEVTRLEAASPNPFEGASFDAWDPAFIAESRLAPIQRRFESKYVRLMLLERGRYALVLDDGGGHLSPWGIVVGPPDMLPTEFHIPVSQTWEPGVFFYDAISPR